MAVKLMVGEQCFIEKSRINFGCICQSVSGGLSNLATYTVPFTEEGSLAELIPSMFWSYLAALFQWSKVLQNCHLILSNI